MNRMIEFVNCTCAVTSMTFHDFLSMTCVVTFIYYHPSWHRNTVIILKDPKYYLKAIVLKYMQCIFAKHRGMFQG